MCIVHVLMAVASVISLSRRLNDHLFTYGNGYHALKTSILETLSIITYENQQNLDRLFV